MKCWQYTIFVFKAHMLRPSDPTTTIKFFYMAQKVKDTFVALLRRPLHYKEEEVVTMSQNRWHRLLVASFTPPSVARLPQLISWSQ